MKTAARRYKGVIDAYDVWNEPWIHAWWAVKYDAKAGDERAGYVTSAEPQKDFANLMKAAFQGAKEIDPASTVAGFNSTAGAGWKGSMGGSAWTKGVLDSGGLDSCDVIEYHHYTNDMAGLPDFAALAEISHGPISDKLGKLPKPVWMSEGHGAIGLMASGFYHHTLPYEDTDDYTNVSNRLCRYVVSCLSQGVSRVFLYSMHSHGFFMPAPASWPVFVTQEGYLHPSGAAHAAMAWHLEDTKPIKVLEVGPGVYAFLFEGRGRSVAVLALKPGGKPWPLPDLPRVTAADLFGNPPAPGEALTEKLLYLSAQTDAAELEKMLLPAGRKEP